MPVTEFERDIIGVTLQDDPINLLHPNVNLMAVMTNSTTSTIEAKISKKIIEIATPSIFEHLFNQLCPGYSKEPHTVLNHIQ
jgi:hypothetical protein